LERQTRRSSIVLIHEIDPAYLLSAPPELSRPMASGRWKELNLLLHSIILLGDEISGDDPMLPLLRASASIASCDRALLYRWDEVASTVHLEAWLDPGREPAAEIQSSNIQAHTCLLHRKPVAVSRPREDFLREELRRLDATAVLSVPMTHQGMPWGALQVMRNRPFLKDESVLLWMFAMLLEGVLPPLLGSRRLQQTSRSVDPGTGLLTPDHFRKRLAWEIQRAASLGRPLTVACVEVAGSMPTGVGRTAGPGPIEAGRMALRALRKHDTATCMAADHFVAALPDAGPEQAREWIRAVKEGFVTGSAGTLPLLDILSGTATYPEDGRSEEKLIRAACSAARRDLDDLSRFLPWS